LNKKLSNNRKFSNTPEAADLFHLKKFLFLGTYGNRSFFLKKIKDKIKLNCKKNIVNSFAKYISIDKWINENVF
jgi:hypothetical protein